MKFGCAFSLSAAVIVLSGCLSSGSAIGPAALPEGVSSPMHAEPQTSGDLLYISAGRNEQILAYPEAKLLATFGYGNARAMLGQEGQRVRDGFPRRQRLTGRLRLRPFGRSRCPTIFPKIVRSIRPAAISPLRLPVSRRATRAGGFSARAGAPRRPTRRACSDKIVVYDNQGHFFRLRRLHLRATRPNSPRAEDVYSNLVGPESIRRRRPQQWDGHMSRTRNPGLNNVMPAFYQVTISGRPPGRRNDALKGAYEAFGGSIDGGRACSVCIFVLLR